MADEHRRELERQAAQGDTHAQARLLMEGVRAGDLDPKMLELAAYCLHPASRLAISKQVGDHHALVENWDKWDGFTNWSKGLKRWGKKVLVRASISATQSVLFLAPDFLPDADPVAQALQIAVNWLRRPGRINLREAVYAAYYRGEDFVPFSAVNTTTWGTHAWESAIHTVTCAADPMRASSQINSSCVKSTCSCFVEARKALNSARQFIASGNPLPQTWDEEIEWLLSKEDCEEYVAKAVSKDLISWALGEGDPILDNPTPDEPPTEGTD